MEGLLQSFKYESPDMQEYVCTLVGFKAKKKGYNKNWWTKQTLYWNGEPIKRDSQEYQDLLDEAFNALFRGNKKAQAALLATGDAVLKHSIGKKKITDTVLTEKEFCSRLMKIREQLRAEQFMEF